MRNRNELVSVVGGRALRSIFNAKPSIFIPFKGEFPLLGEYRREDLLEVLRKTQYMDEITDKELKEAIIKASHIGELEESFMLYLGKRNINKVKWIKIPNADKSDYLLNWMEISCVDYTQLTIK